MKALLRFGKYIRYCDYNCTRVQVSVINLLTNKKSLLSINKGAKLFPKVCNIQYNGTFIAYVSYSEAYKNNIRLIKGKDKEDFIKTHAEYFI